jgi:hypothetical protein
LFAEDRTRKFLRKIKTTLHDLNLMERGQFGEDIFLKDVVGESKAF